MSVVVRNRVVLHTARVAGALLVAPPDTERPDMPPQLHNWKPIRRPRLPFASIAVVSTDDPYGSLERVTEFTQAWGSRVVVAAPRGHLNGDSGLGDWPGGRVLLNALRT